MMNNKQKFYVILLNVITFFLLVSCKNSDSIKGTWNVQNDSGEVSEMTITDTTMTVNNVRLEVKQITSGTTEGKKYFEMEIGKVGRVHIIFPEKQDDTVAIMVVPNTKEPYLRYAMNRERQPDYTKYDEKYVKQDLFEN